MSWLFSPKTRLFFVVIVLVTIIVTLLMDMIGLRLPGTTKVLIIVGAVIFYVVLITILEIMKRRILLAS